MLQSMARVSPSTFFNSLFCLCRSSGRKTRKRFIDSTTRSTCWNAVSTRTSATTTKHSVLKSNLGNDVIDFRSATSSVPVGESEVCLSAECVLQEGSLEGDARADHGSQRQDRGRHSNTAAGAERTSSQDRGRHSQGETGLTLS